MKISPGIIDGVVEAPPSKSVAQRCAALALLAEGKTTLDNFPSSNDSVIALDIIKSLGATVSLSARKAIIQGTGPFFQSADLNCGESGLSMRMFACIAALGRHPIKLYAEGSLRNRPLHMITEALHALGATATSVAGKAPIEVSGPLQGRNVTIDGATTSQVLSGLLIALPLAGNSSLIKVTNLRSAPYVALTKQLIEQFGVQIKSNADYSEFLIDGNQNYRPQNLSIEGDWSSAASILVAGAIAGKIKVTGLNPHSLQADRLVIDILTMAGAKVSLNESLFEVEQQSLKAFSSDLTNAPDLFPVVSVLALAAQGTTRLYGASRLRQKESDRATALVTELRKVGAEIDCQADLMTIKGGRILKGSDIDSHNDHRIAMAGALAGLISSDGVSINNPACVNKSYPDFFKDLNKSIKAK